METIAFELNGHSLEALVGETILQAADRAGVADIPRLCYKEGYRADGNCRSCVVELKVSAYSRRPAVVTRSMV